MKGNLTNTGAAVRAGAGSGRDAWVAVVQALVFFGVVAGAWEAGSRAGWWNPVLIPAPSDIFRYIGEALGKGELQSACFVTMRRLLSGYAVGTLLGFPLGLLTVGWVFEALP